MKTSQNVVRFADSVEFSDGSGPSIYCALNPTTNGAQGGSSESATRSTRSARREEVVEMRKTLQDLQKNFNDVNGEVIQLRQEVARHKEELRSLAARCCQGRCGALSEGQHASKCNHPPANTSYVRKNTAKVEPHALGATSTPAKPNASSATNRPTPSGHSHNKRVDFAAAQAGIQPNWRLPFARRQNKAPTSAAATVGSPPRTDPYAHFNATDQPPQHCTHAQHCTWSPEERRGDVDPALLPSWLADELSPGYDVEDIEEAVDYHYRALGWSSILPRLREAQSPGMLEATIDYITYARLWQARIIGVHTLEGGFRFGDEACNC